MSPVGRLVFKTSEVHSMRLVGSTPTSSASLSSNEQVKRTRPRTSVWVTVRKIPLWRLLSKK